MALTLTRFTDLRSEQDEEEAKRKKTSGSARLKAAMESENVPQPTKEPEAKTEEPAKLSGSARLQAAMENEPTKTNTTTTETKTPQVSNTYREVDKEKGRIRTRSADLSTPSWQDDPEELERKVKGKSSALQLTGSALSMANAAYQAASARKQTADNLLDLYNQSIAKYQGVLEDEKTTAQEKLAAKRQLSALAPYQRQALTNAQRAGEDYSKAETAYNAGRTQYDRQQAGLKQDREALTRRWGLGDSKAAEYEKQADELRKEVDNLYRSGQATASSLRLAESAEANALKERENYAKYLYATQGEEAANRYAAGEREKEEKTSFAEKVLNTIGGTAANFFSGIAGAPWILISRLMELPDDALYAITGNEAFNLDREPYLRNSKALEASDPFRETAADLKQRAGSLGGMIIDTGYAAGSLMGVGGLTGQVTGALANTGLMTKLTSIAESSPLLTSPAARRGAQMAVNALRNPGNLGISLSSGVSSYSEALENGANFSQALANGLWKGLTEYVSNRMFSGTPMEDIPGEKGYVTKAIEFVADKLGKSDVLRALNQTTGGKVLNWLFDKAGEGMEEVITGVFDPIIDRLTYDTEAEWAPKLDALTDEFIGGVLLSLLMTGGEAAMTGAVNLSTDRKIADYLVENWGIEQAEARKYAPQIRKALKATQDATEAVRQAETPAQQTTLQQIIQKYTTGGKLTGQDARKILADPEAKQALMDAGLITGREMNDSAGRTKIAEAAEEYARQETVEEAQAEPENTPPVPGQAENAPETVRATENNAQIGAENAQVPEEPLSGIERLNAARAALEGRQEETQQRQTETPGGKTIQKALAQQRTKEAGKAQSLRDSGFTTASEDATVKVRAEENWDAEEKAVGQALRDLGYEPTFTAGIIHNAEGNSVPFLVEGNKLAIRADHRTQSIQALAEQAIGRGLNIDAGSRNQAMEDINRARETQRAQAAEENKPKVSARAQAAMDSAREAGASEDAGALAGRLADIIGRDIRFFNEAGQNGAWKNGYTQNGVIYVNAQAKKTVAWVVGHELTHNVEHSKIYDSLKKLAQKDMGLNWGLRVQSRMNTSARIAEKLGDDSVRLTDPADAEREIVADFFADRLLTDEASIRAVCEYEPVTARSIRDYIKSLLRKLGGKESTLEKAVQLYNKALKEVAAKAQANAEGRLRLKGTETHNRRVLVSEDTVDKWLKDYAAKSSPKYAQAYITRMTPKQFVDLTTSTTGRLLIGNQTEAMDAEKLIEATRDQPLQIQISDGEVVGHEGRHRATALSRAGVDSIPVLVFDYSNKYSKTDVPEMTLQGQDFGRSRSYATETLRDLVPLSYENRDRIVREYGTQPATERLQEQYNGRKTVQFSAEDSDDEYRQAPGTEALDKLGIRLAASKGRYHLAEQLLERDKADKALMRATKKAEQKLKATKAEKEFAAGIAAGIYEERDIPSSMNKNTVTTLADYYAAEEGFKTNMLAEVRGRINAEYRAEAKELLADVENFKKLSMLSLNERTPDRTFRAMFGPKQGKAIFDWLIRPVQMNEAAKIRWHQKQLDKVRKFEDSKGKTRALTRAESELTMLVMEGKAAAAAVADMEKKGLDAKGIRNAAENIRNGEDAEDAAWEFGLKDKEREIAKNYARWMDTQEKLKKADSTIIENAAEAYSKIFDEFYDGINDFLVAHGYEPIGYIKGYAPHMQPEETQNLLEKAFDKMGISLGNDKAQGLPASIAGETAYFKPNKRWDPYFLHRTGTQAEYDIEKAYQSYVGYLSDILFHTDDIMRVRNFEKMIRKTYAPEEIRDDLEMIQVIRDARQEDRQGMLRNQGRIGKTTQLSAQEISESLDTWEEELFNALKEDRNYNNLVMWLSNYANILAGKQSFADRGWEYSLGRNSLNFANRLQAAFQRSLVAGSLTSAMNQTAQLPMIKAELGDRWYYAALKDILTGQTRGFWKDSDFLTGKHGVDMLYTDNYDKFISVLFKPSTAVDNIVSTTAVRGAFLKAINQGQSYSEAMRTADDFGRKVMGSREKGTRPLAYESKGLFSRMIHMFQVEAANSWDHIASDLPYEIKEIARTQGKPKATLTLGVLLLRGLLSAFVLNRITEELYGGTPAPFDVIGLAMNFVASGQGMTTNRYLKTIIDNGLEKIGTDRFYDTEDVDTEFDVGKGLEELGYNVMNDVPLLRNLAGVLGLGDQTVPLPGAGGEFADMYDAAKDLIQNGNEGKQVENLIRATLKFGFQLFPAGRQITKTGEGVEAVIRGGSYNKKGNLQYPIDDTADKVKAILFGKNATNAARDHWASGESTMSEKQTGMVAKLRGQGMTGAEAQDAARTVKSFSGDDKRDQTVAYIDSLNITDSLKDEMYFYAGYKESTLNNTPWHNKGGSSGKGKTYSMSGLRLPTPERRAPTGSGLKLQSAPAARPSGGLRLK